MLLIFKRSTIFSQMGIKKCYQMVKHHSTKGRKTLCIQANLKQKFAIVVAGPAFNYILAIFLYAFVACFNGVSISPNVVGNVLLDGSAYTAGLRIGDEIFEINGDMGFVYTVKDTIITSGVYI